MPPTPHSSTTPRSVSPNPSLQESLSENTTRERSYESLLKEIKQLQDVLTAREAEISGLEANLKAQDRKSSVASTSSSVASGLSEQAPSADQLAAAGQTEVPPEPSQLSPRSMDLLSTLKTELGLDASEPDMDGIRVDDLMRSMARKEAVHRDAVEDLNQTLASIRKQHASLEQLSKDQVDNMCREIEGLRQQLLESHNDHQSMVEKVAELEAELAAANSERSVPDGAQEEHEAALEALRQEHSAALSSKDEEHARAVSQLQDEHSAFLGQMVEERQALFVERAKNHDDQLQLVRSESSSTMDRVQQDHKEALSSAEVQIANLQSERDALQADLQKMATDSARDAEEKNVVESLHQQHQEALQQRDAQHAAALEALKQEHSEMLMRTKAEHASQLREENEGAHRSLIESHAMQIAELQKEAHARATEVQAELQHTVSEKQQSLSDAAASHAEAIERLRLEMSNKHAEEMRHMKEVRTVSRFRDRSRAGLNHISGTRASCRRDARSSRAAWSSLVGAGPASARVARKICQH